MTVIDAKPEGNPGFIVLDARGEKYVIKFDPPEFPGIETTTDMIVDRFFWGFGCSVPEDYVFLFRRDEDMRIDPNDRADMCGLMCVSAAAIMPHPVPRSST